MRMLRKTGRNGYVKIPDGFGNRAKKDVSLWDFGGYLSKGLVCGPASIEQKPDR